MTILRTELTSFRAQLAGVPTSIGNHEDCLDTQGDCLDTYTQGQDTLHQPVVAFRDTSLTQGGGNRTIPTVNMNFRQGM